MNILFTICGRAGSKGFKNKNLKVFMDTPLIYYSLAAVYLYKQKHSLKNQIDVVLNTDSIDLIHIAQDQTLLNIDIVQREKSLGGDTVPKVKVIKDSLLRMEERYNGNYDIVIDLDITSPLRTVSDIERAIERKMKRKDTDVVYSVTNARRNPYFNMVKEEEGYFIRAVSSDYTTRQQAPTLYDMNASIYVYAPDSLKIKNPETFFNDKCDAIIMEDTGILDIDSEEDFELMQAIAQYLRARKPEISIIADTAKKMHCNK